MTQTDITSTNDLRDLNTPDGFSYQDMPEYKISIIISCYNGEKYIPALIHNLKRQTIGFEDLEVIFVDDCSKDHSAETLRSYEKKYPNIHMIRLPKNSGGASRPRNTGLKNAHGEYVMFLDIDDPITLNGIEKAYEAITLYDADFVISNALLLLNGAYYKLNDFCQKIIKSDNSSTGYSNMIIVGMLISREFLLKNNIRFKEIRLGEDELFALESYVKTRKAFYTIPDPILIYNYKISSDSVTHNITTDHMLTLLDNLDHMMHICKRLNREFKKDMYANYIPVVYSFLFHLRCFDKKNVIKIFRQLNRTQNKYKRFSSAVKGLIKPVYNLISKGHYTAAFLITKAVYLIYDTPLFIKLFRFKNTKKLSKEEYEKLKGVLP